MALKGLTRRVTGRMRGQGRTPKPTQSWSTVAENPAAPDRLEHFGFYAVLGTWYEGDVVEACVRNARAQGCERIFLVDNDSPDDTVERAVAAGAELAHSFHTEHYDEDLRMRLMNDVVATRSLEQDDDHVWWLWLDADEFAHGPGGLTLHDHLAGLDRRFRVVGTRYLNHYPSGAPQCVRGAHPIDYQPLAEALDPPFCAQRHRKHPLQRWDREAPPIICEAGFHRAHSDAPILEPTVGAYLHHFPFRDEAISRARLDALCGGSSSRARPDDPATAHMLPRYRSLEAVYEQRWDDVENFVPGKGRGVDVRPWTELVPPTDQAMVRW